MISMLFMSLPLAVSIVASIEGVADEVLRELFSFDVIWMQLIQLACGVYRERVPPELHRIFDSFRLDASNAQLWRDKEQITLRPKTFDVLRYLVDHPGELVTKAALLDAVWPEVSVSDSMPATCIAELRRALKDDAKTPRLIETVHRRGYRFIAKVTTAAIAQPSGSRRRLRLVPSQ
jgi:DNA-binding winged helix-turn-helix (wHTH) protein